MTTAIGNIHTVRLNNTVNGNPRYSITFMPDSDPIANVNGVTKSDAQFTYSMPRDGKAQCTWHETPTGRIVFDNVEYLAG